MQRPSPVPEETPNPSSSPVPKPTAQVTLIVQSSDGKDQNAVRVRVGMPLQGIAALNPETVALEFDCRKADCGVCLFISPETNAPGFLSPPTYQERDYLKAMGCTKGERLGCQTRILASGTIVLIPA